MTVGRTSAAMIKPLIALMIAGPCVAQSVVGIVVDSLTSEPIPAVWVILNNADPVMTGHDGRFRITNAQWLSNRNVLEFRRIGYRPARRHLAPTNDSSELSVHVVLQPTAIHMEPVVVDGVQIRVPAKLAGFYRRREFGRGEYLTAAEIERIPAVGIVDVLRQLPGLELSAVGADKRPFRTTPRITTFRSGGICPTNTVYVDGVLIDISRLVDVPPEQIAGIEFYSGPSQVPLRFNRTGAMCGVLVIWTK